MKNNYKYIFTVFISLPFITVFMTSKELYNGIMTAKMFYFYAVNALLLLSIAFYLVFKKKSIKVSLNLLDILILLYLAYNFLRLLTTDYSSFQDDNFIWLVLLTVLYFLWKYLITFDENYKLDNSPVILFIVFLLSGLLQALYGIMQLYNISPGVLSNQFKVIGTLGNPDYFAGFLITIAPLAFGIYLLSKNKKVFPSYFTTIALSTFLVCIFILPSTLSRTSWLSCAVGVLFILWNKYDLTNKISAVFNSKLKVLTGSIVSILLCGIIAVGLFQIKPDSASGRLLVWKISTKIIANNPLLGSGFNRFSVDYNNYQANYFANGNGTEKEKVLADNVRHAHNEYLQIASEIGLVGLLLFIGILFTALISNKVRSIPKNEFPEKTIVNLSVKASLCALLVFSFFSFPLHILPTLINFYFLLAILSSSSSNKYPLSFSLSQYIWKPTLILLIVAIAFLTSNKITLYEKYYERNQAYFAALNGNFKLAENIYAELLPGFNNDGEFLFNYGSSLAAIGKFEEAITYLETARNGFSDPNLYITRGQTYANLGDIDKAEANLFHASNMIPSKLFPKYLLAKLYFKNNMTEKAKQKANEILMTKDKIETTAAAEIRKEIRDLINNENNDQAKNGLN